MLPITLFIMLCATSFAQLQVTPLTTFDVLIGALMGLGLPNATEYFTEDQRQVASQAANSTTVDGCLLACNLLRDVLNLNNSLPTNYAPQSEYWAAQQQVTLPTCFVTPGTTPYVAAAVLVLEYFQCPFAIKSGGSSPFGSNIASPGVVIDLRTFRSLDLSRDRSVVTIGTGQNWGTVIDGMGTLGYMVPAAYSANVGVGGYILNGGISFASSRYGLTADNVVRFEVVTANGSILDATLNKHEDLYWALRGGGAPSFTIVTQFDLSTFPVPQQFWGGVYTTDLQNSKSVFEAFEDFIRIEQLDDSGAQFSCAVSTSNIHATLSHLDGTLNPSALDGILAIPSTASSLGVRTMSDLAREIAAISPNGNRELFSTFTVEVNATWMQQCSQFFLDKASQLQDMLQDRMLEPRLSFESLSLGIIDRAADNGGGPMDSESMVNGSFVVAHLGFGWLEEKDDAIIQATADQVFRHCTRIASQIRNPFIYPGYAAANQDVLSGFGKDNKKRLESVTKAYDPDEWFRKLQPNGLVAPLICYNSSLC